MQFKGLAIKLLVVMMGVFFSFTDVYAANGDLIVNGSIGVGTSIPLENFHLSGNAFISGDTFFYNKDGAQRGSIHYGLYGKIGQPYSYNWNPEEGRTGLWIEGSHDGESAGIFLNGNTMVLWSPGDADILRVYDEDTIFNGSTPTPLFVIDGAGNVGIRMTYKIPWTWYTYALNVNGTAFATGYWQSSDKKLKENITSIYSALDMILNIDGVSFTWKQEDNEGKEVLDAKYETNEDKKVPDAQKGKKNGRFPEGKHYGVIAQDIEKVMPEIVKEGVEGEKAVSYTELIPVLIEAIKEQQELIQKQQSSINEIMKALGMK